MNLNEALSDLAPCTAQSFDSNNGWGFGGARGVRWEIGACVVKIGTAFYRHLRSHGFITVTVRGVRVLDDFNTSAAESRVLELLREHAPEFFESVE